MNLVGLKLNPGFFSSEVTFEGIEFDEKELREIMKIYIIQNGEKSLFLQAKLASEELKRDEDPNSSITSLDSKLIYNFNKE